MPTISPTCFSRTKVLSSLKVSPTLSWVPLTCTKPLLALVFSCTPVQLMLMVPRLSQKPKQCTSLLDPLLNSPRQMSLHHFTSRPHTTYISKMSSAIWVAQWLDLSDDRDITLRVRKDMQQVGVGETRYLGDGRITDRTNKASHETKTMMQRYAGRNTDARRMKSRWNHDDDNKQEILTIVI